MTAFLGIAALMVVAAIAVVLWPLLRSNPGQPSRWPAIAVSVLLPVFAFGLYGVWSNWSWKSSPQVSGAAANVPQKVAELEAKLVADPHDTEGWLMLGHSYFELHRYLRSADAYEQAYTQTGGENVDAILGLGEALVFAEDRTITPRAAQLFERAVQLAPHHPKALWYSGLGAYENGRLGVARERWSALLALDAPPEVKRVLEAKIAEIDKQVGPGSGPGAGAATPATTPVVKVRVRLDPKLADRVPQGAPLFVMVRAGEGGGPPLAVTRRSSAQLPMLVELSDRDAMVAGRSLADVPSLTVVARIARSGGPRAQSGDLEGKVGYDPKNSTPVDLLIDSIVP